MTALHVWTCTMWLLLQMMENNDVEELSKVSSKDSGFVSSLLQQVGHLQHWTLLFLTGSRRLCQLTVLQSTADRKTAVADSCLACSAEVFFAARLAKYTFSIQLWY